jgi:hypothetical protein
MSDSAMALFGYSVTHVNWSVVGSISTYIQRI